MGRAEKTGYNDNNGIAIRDGDKVRGIVDDLFLSAKLLKTTTVNGISATKINHGHRRFGNLILCGGADMKFLLSADGDVAVNAEEVTSFEILPCEGKHYIIGVNVRDESYSMAKYETLDEAKKELSDLLKVLSGYASDGILNLIERYKKHEG